MPTEQQPAAAAAAGATQPAAAAPKHKSSNSQAQAAPRKVRFNVGTQYQVLDVVGEGAYGIVCSAVHRPTGRKVAIKKIAPFDHSMFCLRTLRELKLLKFLSEAGVSENIISILDIIKPPSIDAFKEVYLIQELMETDMHRVIRTQDLSDDHAQYFIYQTLRALKALHSADVIHRDLKPSNLLLNANCDLKVCDFGLARSVKTAEPSGTETGFMTEYVATRWYRAPEIMLSFQSYTKAIDVWSVGCILAELLGGRPFFKGRDYVDQLNQILHILGTPNEETLSRIGSPRAQEYVRNLPFMAKRPFPSLFPNANPDALDLLDHMLAFDPSSRISVETALEHPYLHIWHDASDEPGCPTTFNFDFEVVEDVGEMRKMILDEVHRFRQHVRIQPGQQAQNQGPAVPIPQAGGSWRAEDPRPQETYGQGAGGLEQDLQGGLDAMHG